MEFINTPPHGSPDGYDVIAKRGISETVLDGWGSGGLAQRWSCTTAAAAAAAAAPLPRSSASV